LTGEAARYTIRIWDKGDQDMKLGFRHCDPLVVLVCVLGLGPVRAVAGTIVGIDTGNPQQNAFVAVDPLTGNVTPLTTIVGFNNYFVTSSGPANNSVLAYSPVNLYQIDLITGAASLYACAYEPQCSSVGDLAYDSSNRAIYGLGRLYGTGPEALFQLNDSGMEYPGIPGSHMISYSQIGYLGVDDISVMEYVPGLGLYGVANGNTPAGFMIDETTGQATFLTPLSEAGVPYGITGLAYDSETGRLLASSGNLFGPGSTGEILLLDPTNGSLTPLNVDAPNLYGIAEVRTPEPGPAWMVFVGLTACFVVQRFRLNSPRGRSALS
jgi:hypothetical protein